MQVSSGEFQESLEALLREPHSDEGVVLDARRATAAALLADVRTALDCLRIAEALQRDDSREGTSLVRAALEQAWNRRPVGDDDTEWEDAWWDDALDSFVTDQTARDQLRTWANTLR